MARNRSKNILATESAEANPEVAAEDVLEGQEQQEEAVEAPVPAENEAQEKADEPKDGGAQEAVTSEIPEKARELLRIFNSYDLLYVTPWGGVFMTDHLPSHVKDAVLYKNPFFKK